MRLRDALSVLRQRNYRSLFLGQFVSLLGDSMVTVALAFAVLDLTGSASDLGLVLMARTIPMVALVLVGGVIGDRLSRRLVMVTADGVRCASQGTLAALLITGRPTVAVIAALQVVHGLASAFFQPASTGLLPLVVEDLYLQPANALRGLAMSATTIGGPAIAGVLVATVGSGWAIAADAASFAVSAAFVLGITGVSAAVPSGQSFLRDLRDGWSEFVGRTWVWTVVVASSLGNMLFASFQVLGPYVAKRSLGGATAWGLITAAIGVGAVAGGLAVLRYQPRRPLFVACALLPVFALPVFGLAIPLPAAGVAAVGLVFGAAMMVCNGLWETSLQRHVPAAALSRVSAYDWFGSLVFAPLGLAVVGPVALQVGTGTTLWATGGLILVVTLPLLAVPSIRSLPGAADADLSEPRPVIAG